MERKVANIIEMVATPTNVPNHINMKKMVEHEFDPPTSNFIYTPPKLVRILFCVEAEISMFE